MSTDLLRFKTTKLFSLGLFAAWFEALSAVGLLATSAYLISRASEQPPILYLMVAVVGVRAFALGRATFRYLHRLALHDAVFRELTGIRPKVFARLAQLVPGALSSRGQALESFTSDVERLQDYPLRVMVPVLQAISAVLTMFAISLWIFPFASIWLVLASVVFALLVLWLSSISSQGLEEDRIQLQQKLREELVGYLENIDLLESYGWADNWRSKIKLTSGSIARIDLRRVIPIALATALIGLGSALTAILGGILVGDNLGEVVPAVLAVAVLMPLAVFDVFSQLQSVAAAWKGFRSAKGRLQQIMTRDLPDEMVVMDGEAQLSDLRSISLRDLSLQRGQQVLYQGLNLELVAGEMVAVIGPSGVGKTSLALALCSLISPSGGQILFNGTASEAFTIESRRRQVVLIEQQPHIFRGSVRQNLEISGNLDDSQMISALGLVGLDFEFEARGLLEAELSESAGNISGGQAQRLAIARGLLAGARFIILDEPTSGLDRANGLALMEILRQLTGRSVGVLVITHDQEIAGLCDRTLDLGNL